MIQEHARQIPVIYPPGEDEAGRLVRQAVDDSLGAIGDSWGLEAPQDCRIYVMTSWMGFVFQSAPLPWKVLLALSLPLWVARTRRTWNIGAAWTLHYGRRVAIGIKPPRLLELSDQRVGKHMYEPETDPGQKLRQLTCHELTHACLTPLRLPAWLNEGLAFVTVDRCLGKRTIRLDTLELLRRTQPKETPPGYRQMMGLEHEQIAYHAVRGYWLVRYLEERAPGFLKRSLGSAKLAGQVEGELPLQLDLPEGEFWQQIDEKMVAHFQGVQG